MRLRDLLPQRRRTTTPVPAAGLPSHASLAALFPARDADTWRSPLCRTGDPVGHARCRHAANRARFDGCSCGCHTTTTYDDGGTR